MISLLYLGGLIAYTWTAYAFFPPDPAAGHRRELPIIVLGLLWAPILAYGLAPA